jgi:hypothetical protein
VQTPAVYWVLLHRGCTTFRQFLLELSHDLGEHELIRVQVLCGLGERRVPYIF